MILSLAIIALLIGVVSLLARYSPKDPDTVACYGSNASFLGSFSLRTYKPMLRLATQMDKAYLESVHGKTLASCYRKIQKNLLREYLEDASKDFNRLYAIATAKAVQANSDPGDLSLALFEQQISFILSVWGIEARLLLGDVLPFKVDLEPLVAHLETLAQQTRALARPQYGYTTL